MTEDEKIEQWIKNPIVPEWLKKEIQDPVEPDTIHYDENLQKVIYTKTQSNETIAFDTLEEAHDSKLINDKNTEIITDIPNIEMDEDRAFISVRTNDGFYRMLFFNTEKQSYEMLLYKLYIAHNASENFQNNSTDFQTAQFFVHSHLLNWEKSQYDHKDYETEKTIKKQAFFNGDEHFWKVSATVLNKTTMNEDSLEAEGKTVEQAIINLARGINSTYNWTGEVRND